MNEMKTNLIVKSLVLLQIVTLILGSDAESNVCLSL